MSDNTRSSRITAHRARRPCLGVLSASITAWALVGSLVSCSGVGVPSNGAAAIPGAGPDPVAARVPPGFRIEKVFGPEIPGTYKHPSSFTELDGGDLYLVYHGGSGEYENDTAIFGARWHRSNGRWDSPRVIADTPWRGDGNAVVWEAPDRLVWLFWVCRSGTSWSTSRTQAKISSDGARTWSDPILISPESGVMVRSRPLSLANGEFLLPVYHEVGDDPEFVTSDCASFFFRHDPRTRSWTETNRVRSRLGNIQPAVAKLSNGTLVAYCRRGGDYEGRPDGFVVRTESRDDGRTWSPGTDSPFPNPNAAVDFLRLSSGRLLLVYNHSPSDRRPLSIAISEDDDASYPLRVDLVTAEGSFSYPTILQSADGLIHLVFTSDERTVIRHAVFTEDDLLAAARRAQ
jgi:predicted neuraminidase